MPTKREVIAALLSASISGGAIAMNQPLSTVQIKALQQKAIASEGAPIRLLTDNDIRESGIRLPENTRVNVYEQADGKRGFDIILETEDGWHYTSFGPQAKERTKFVEKIKPVASSTPL